VAHAPDEYHVIESTNPKVQGIDGAVRSQIEYLYELAAASSPAAEKPRPPENGRARLRSFGGLLRQLCGFSSGRFFRVAAGSMAVRTSTGSRASVAQSTVSGAFALRAIAGPAACRTLVSFRFHGVLLFTNAMLF
jgi:hypothetical protein